MIYLDRVYDWGMEPCRYLKSGTKESSYAASVVNTAAAVAFVAPGMILAIGASIAKFLLSSCGGLNQRENVVQLNQISSEESRLESNISCFMNFSPEEWTEWRKNLFRFADKLHVFSRDSFEMVNFFKSMGLSAGEYTRPCFRGSLDWDLFMTVATSALGTVTKQKAPDPEEIRLMCQYREIALAKFDEALELYLNTCDQFKKRPQPEEAMADFRKYRQAYARAVCRFLGSLQAFCATEGNRDLRSNLQLALRWWAAEARASSEEVPPLGAPQEEKRVCPALSGPLLKTVERIPATKRNL